MINLQQRRISIKTKEDDSLFLLVKKVRKLKLRSKNDLIRARGLSELIFEKWINIRRGYKKKSMNTKKYNKYLPAELEAEENMIVGLIILLNEKLIEKLK